MLTQYFLEKSDNNLNSVDMLNAIVKFLMNNLTELLVNLLNSCLIQSTFPEEFKISRVVSVFKGTYER